MSKTFARLRWIANHGSASSFDMAREFRISVWSVRDWARNAIAQGILVKRWVRRGVVMYSVSPMVRL